MREVCVFGLIGYILKCFLGDLVILEIFFAVKNEISDFFVKNWVAMENLKFTGLEGQTLFFTCIFEFRSNSNFIFDQIQDTPKIV